MLDAKLAQEIVQRTMDIIGCNINIMNRSGIIIASGDLSRIGKVHDGALLVLAQKRVVEIDEGSMQSLYGVRPGINLPLKVNGDIIGVIGLTGEPKQLVQFGHLVSMTAEMMLEQAELSAMLVQDARLKEELILNLIKTESISPALYEWAKRLGVDLSMPRVACIIEINSQQVGIENIRNELQNLQMLLKNPERDNLVAIRSLTELVILKPALNERGYWDNHNHMERVHQLMSRMNQQSLHHVYIALGHYFPDSDRNSIALSYQTAKTTMKIGKAHLAEQRVFNYQDLMLPVLLDQLQDGWQKKELERTIMRLKNADKNGILQKTLSVWFACNMQASAAAKALYIHRNTLDYRLNQIAMLTGLDTRRTDDLFLLYIAIKLN